jgi:hypothetical protein
VSYIPKAENAGGWACAFLQVSQSALVAASSARSTYAECELWQSGTFADRRLDLILKPLYSRLYANYATLHFRPSESSFPCEPRAFVLHRYHATVREAGETMVDDLSSLERQAQDPQACPQGQDYSSRYRSHWSGIIAVLIFCILYLPFRNHSWSWPVAIAGSYTTLTFGLALASALRYADDFFGNPRVPEYVATLLWPHALILIPVTLLAWLWFRAIPYLPHWATEARKISLWELCLIVSLVCAGLKESDWLAARIKRRAAASDN